MCRFVSEHECDLRITVLPGVRKLLHHLRTIGKILGIATGNLEGIGRSKLRSAALLDYFDFGGYSDAYEFRHGVFRGAVDKARGLAGVEARICVVGDTPEDIRAARSNGLDVIAVATGIFSYATLQSEAQIFVCVRWRILGVRTRKLLSTRI